MLPLRDQNRKRGGRHSDPKKDGVLQIHDINLIKNWLDQLEQDTITFYVCLGKDNFGGSS